MVLGKLRSSWLFGDDLFFGVGGHFGGKSHRGLVLGF